MLLLITLFFACSDTRTPEEKHIQFVQNRCRSKVKGSSPSCWNEDDWAAFCKHVQCIPQEKSHEE